MTILLKKQYFCLSSFSCFKLIKFSNIKLFTFKAEICESQHNYFHMVDIFVMLRNSQTHPSVKFKLASELPVYRQALTWFLLMMIDGE